MYICIYVYMYICIYVYMYICIYVYVYMYICIYVCVYICVCMYVYHMSFPDEIYWIPSHHCFFSSKLVGPTDNAVTCITIIYITCLILSLISLKTIFFYFSLNNVKSLEDEHFLQTILTFYNRGNNNRFKTYKKRL